MPNPIALAIPFFFLLMGVEIFFARRRRLSLYRFPDVIADISCGMTQQILLVFEVATLTGGYVWLYQHRLFTFAAGSIWPWVIAFFAVDFTYYWWHRLSHRVTVLWAVHAVHHQSEDYNLAVALRQAVLSVWTIWPLHLPLALIGIPPATFLVVDSLSTLYQFWIHTELIGRLGWYEWIFNTPSQHRVHHALRLGPPVRNVRSRVRAAGLRAGEAPEELRPAARAGVPLRGDRPAREDAAGPRSLARLAHGPGMGAPARSGDHPGAAAEACGGALPPRDRLARDHAGDRDRRHVPAALVSVLAAALEAGRRGRIRAAADGELGSSPRPAPDLEQERQRPEHC